MLRQKDFAYVLFIGCTIFTIPTLIAGDLQIDPNLSLNYFTTNNVNLSSTDKVKESIVQVTPSLSLGYDSASSLLDANFLLNSSRYKQTDNNDETVKQIDTFISTDILKNLFKLNISYLLQQTEIGVTQDQQVDTLFASDSIVDISESVIQPVWIFSKNDIDISLTSSFSKQNIDNSDTDIETFDTDSQDVYLNISSDHASRLNWQINAAANRSEYSNGDENKTRSESATVFYNINSHLRFNTVAGSDSNDTSGQDNTDLNANYWSAGLSWVPSRRSNISLSTGKRFNLQDDNFQISYQGRYTTIDIGSQRQLLTSSVNTDISTDINLNIDTNTQMSLRKTNSLGINYQRKKIQVQFNFQEDQNQSQISNNLSEDDKLSELILSWQVRNRASIAFRFSHQDDEISIENRVDQIDIRSISLNRNFTRNSSATIELRSQKRKSNDAAFNYNESGLEFSFTQQF